MRICPRCKTEKTLSEFYEGKGYCKPCQKEYKYTYRRRDRQAWHKISIERRKVVYNEMRIKLQQYAMRQVHRAILKGVLIRPSNCSICNTTSCICGHHPDYSKPLEVIWVCRLCHTAIHRTWRKLEYNSRK